MRSMFKLRVTLKNKKQWIFLNVYKYYAHDNKTDVVIEERLECPKRIKKHFFKIKDIDKMEMKKITT